MNERIYDRRTFLKFSAPILVSAFVTAKTNGLLMAQSEQEVTSYTHYSQETQLTIPEELKNYNGYRVVGKQVFEASGEQIIFRGVSRPSLEWNPYGDDMHTPERSGYLLMREWGANTVRLPLNQVFWLTDPEYKTRVTEQIAWANQSNLNVILDLHWSGKGDLNLETDAQQMMPDQYSIEFWQEVAETYKDNPKVLFELYNEPHDVTPEVWYQGGMTTDGFHAVGMQKLVDTIRGEGAINIIIVNGLNWGFDHRGLPEISGANIMKGSHPYGHHEGKNKLADFDAAFGYLVNQNQAVIITEFGHLGDCTSDFYKTVTDYAEQKEISWVAWAWFPDESCGFPGIIKNWDGEPHHTGVDIQNALRSQP